MPFRGQRRLSAVVIALLFLVPGIPSFPASGGSTWSTAAPDFQNGTIQNATLTSAGIRLPYNETYLNNWTRVDPWPKGRAGHRMVYDSIDGVFVVFGGSTQDGLTTETWTYNASTDIWKNMRPKSSPTWRAQFAMAYDESDGVVILFGGGNSETWAYNLSNNVWTNKQPQGGPMGWSYTSLVYDPVNAVVVIFGGDWAGYTNQTWVYEAGSNTWTQKYPAVSPSARCGHFMTYDDSIAEIVLFGGSSGSGLINDTWTYNVSQNKWTEKHPQSAPTAGATLAMAYDCGDRLVTLFDTGPTNYGNETWTYNSRTDVWTQMHPASSPLCIWDTALAYDHKNDYLFLFGGRNVYTLPDVAWTYNYTINDWKRETKSPLPRSVQSMSFDTSKNVAVFFGGNDYYSNYNDTWLYDPQKAAWTRLNPTVSPAGRCGQAMAYDGKNKVHLLFGGTGYTTNLIYYTDTWAFDAVNGTWTQKFPDHTPLSTSGNVLAFDIANNVFVLFSPADGATWLYDPSVGDWVQKTTGASPSVRVGTSLVYDEKNGVMVLFGGRENGWNWQQYMNDTWTYNVTTNIWTNMSPPNAPLPRLDHAMAYDKALDRVILFSGNVGYDLNDTWAYDVKNNTWTQLAPFSSAPPRFGHSMVYNDNEGTMLVYGGFNTLPGQWGYYSDIWAFDLKRYISAGTVAPAPFDTGGSAFFGSLEYDADVPLNTSVRLQLRSGPDNATMQAKAFLGPDGTNSSYYNASGQRISPVHNGSRWVQYKVFLETKDPAYSPLFKGATLNYNILHDAALVSPAGDENWTGLQDICWTFSDPDGDGMFVDIDLLRATDEVQLAYGLAVDDLRWEWDTSPTENGTYRIRITVRDDNETIPLSVNITSPEFSVFHPHINKAPSAALVYPENGALLSTPDVTLTWTGLDPEKDKLRYTVYVSGAFFDIDHLPAEGLITHNSSYQLAGLADLSSWFWTVVPYDGQLSGPAPEVRNFTVDIPHAPEVELLYPAYSARLNSTEVELKWNGTDADNDTLFYLVYLDTVPFGPFDLPEPAVNTTAITHIVAGLSNGTTYFWTVVPGDRAMTGPRAQARSFSIDISIGNRLPRFTSTAPLNVTVDELYGYNLTAADDDLDPFTFTKVAGPETLSVNETSGKVSWRPNATGNFTVTVRVTDSKGGFSDQTFSIEVKSKPPVIQRPPTLTVTSSINNTKVKKTITIEGKATAGSRPLSLVQYKVDDGLWQAASGTENWSITLDTTTLGNGLHTIKVRAYDGTSYSGENALNIDVGNAAAAPAGAGFPLWILAVVAVVIVAAAGSAAMLARRKKAAAPAEEASPAPAAVPEDGPHGAETEPSASGKEPLPPEAEEIAIRTGEKAGPAVQAAATGPAAPALQGAAPLAAPLKTAPEGFAVEDIFLMYIDGRLIQHNTRRIKADMDADIMASMLTAVQGFIKESIGMEKGTELGAMEYGDNKILLQKGKHIVLAVVIEGSEPPEFRDEIRHTISNIESEFGPVLASWDGMTSRLAGAKKFLGRLGDYAPAQRPAAQAPAAKDVSVKAELEFNQGFVRLKVAVKNDMPTLIARASFRLVYDEEALRLDRIEPPLECKGNEVQLGIVEPNVKKTVAFYLDPQICTESYLEGILAFKDAHGNLRSVQLPRKLASVVCPIVYTDENINTAMLKRMAAEELDKKDTKVFSIPPALAPELAFDLAEAAVQHHDVKLVREFTEKEPFVGEAWYYGKAKGRQDKLVVRARVLGEKRVLEFFVASGSTLMLTGMLAELKADLNKELESQKGRPEMKQVTTAAEVDAVAKVRTLLDRAAELEQAAGETDLGR